MRIIGGTHRSRTYLGPPDEKVTRPITDRVKVALFNLLVQARALPFAEDDPPAPINVLDIFCGTGSLGLEALSRGADHCTFVDRDRKARKLLEQNLDHFEMADRASVQGVDVLGFDPPSVWVRSLRNTPVRLILLDPPYAATREPVMMKRVIGVAEALCEVAVEGAVLMLRTETEVAGPTLAGWTGPDSRAYGAMTLHLYYR